jgi:UDP-GlcNAc:undecaprenyl-phosphate GlcNAc-1-phosphate transferase
MEAAVLAFALTILLAPVVIFGLRRRGIVDVPNARSSHITPTPRGGGLATATAAAVALAVASGIDVRTRIALLVAVSAFAVLGLGEDLVGIPVMWRLLAQGLAATVVAGLMVGNPGHGSPIRAVLLVAGVLFVVGYVNGFNFMDGINGISAVQVTIVAVSWYLIGHARGLDAFAAGAAIAGATGLGFTPFNFPRARVFLGDVGSYGFGAMLAALALVGLRDLPPEAVLAPLALYVADTGTTLLRRFLRGESWDQPHRDHVYQQLVILGWSHVTTTLMVAAITALLGGLGAVSLAANTRLRVAADMAILAVLIGYLSAPALLRRAQSTAVVAG